jgi:hypothetical protein
MIYEEREGFDTILKSCRDRGESGFTLAVIGLGEV